MMMTESQATNTPFPELADSDGGDYEFCVDISVDRQDIRCGPDGDLLPDRQAPFFGTYEIAAGRRDGRWHLMISPTTTDEFGDIENAGPPLVDLRGQTEGPDPLSLLRAFLTGGNG
jgi:hypothetical protein